MKPTHQDLAPIACGPHTINATYFGGKLISTVKLTHTWAIAGVEYPYETLVFDREGCEIDAAHYLTRKQAYNGHWHAVEIYIQSQ